MAQTIRVTIIGLGYLGTSVGLALQRYNRRGNTQHTFEITGVEDRATLLEEAEKKGAISKTARNLYNAVEERDLVVLAQPYAEVRRTYQAIGDGVRAGGVVLDLSPLKMPSIQWAKEYLSAEAHMVGVTPVINARYLHESQEDTAHAAEDLFDNGSMVLAPSPSCIREAVELASDFAALLGATVRFMDPLEHDSLMGATLGLPTLLGVMSFYTLARSPGWDDLKRLGNPPLGRLTQPLPANHPDDLRDLWLNNRDSLVHYLDRLMDSLGEVRQVLAGQDRDALEVVLAEATEQYDTWIAHRRRNHWDDPGTDRPSTSDSLMSGLMGSFLSRRLRGDSDDQR